MLGADFCMKIVARIYRVLFGGMAKVAWRAKFAARVTRFHIRKWRESLRVRLEKLSMKKRRKGGGISK